MDYLPISKINTVVFCPRRYYIEMILADTLSNHHITDGQTLHERSKREGEDIWVWSDALGINGIIDQIKQEDNEWVITEFKKGYLGDHESDQVQLCAQAISYEEVYRVKLNYGQIFYHKTRRRQTITYSPSLRQKVKDAVAQMRELEKQTQFPPVTSNTNKCKGCSVQEACQPKLSQKIIPRWNPKVS